jgi:hypothetical protein
VRDTALAQNFDKQQGGHQFAMADQFVGQRGGTCQRSGFRQGGDIFQQALNLFANHVGIAQTLQNIELNLAQRFELSKRSAGSSPSAKATRRLVTPAEADNTTTRIGIKQRNINAAVHGIKIGNAGAAEFGYN